MTDKKALEVLKSWLHLAYHNADGTDECSAELYEALQTTFKLITRQQAEIESLNYTLLGVMHSVDKWLDGAELEQDEVNRAATMREKTLRIAEEKQAEIDRLKARCSNCCELRVKSETISELNEQIEYWQRGYNDLLQENKEVKSKTAKEFVKNLKKSNDFYDCVRAIGNVDKIDCLVNIIDNLVKEMVGDKE